MSIRKLGAALLLTLIWALYYFAVGVVNKTIPSVVTGVIIRILVFISLTFSMAISKKLKLLIVGRKSLFYLILVGVIGFLLDITAFIGFRYVSGGIGTVILKADIIYVLLISAIVFKEKIKILDWLAVITMLFGITLITDINVNDLTFNFGYVLFLLSGFFLAVNAFLIKYLQTDPTVKVDNRVIAYYNNGIAMVCFIIAIPIFKVSLDPVNSLNSWVSVLLLVASVGQFLIYKVYYKTLATSPVWIVKTILLLIPVLNLVFDFVFLGQTPTNKSLIGILIVLGSTTFIITRQSKQIKKGVDIK